MQGNARNRERSGPKPEGRSLGSEAAQSKGAEDLLPAHGKSTKRALFYDLCPQAQATIREMDKGTRYENKGETITHRLGVEDGATFVGFLRPLDYLPYLKNQEGINFRALGQLGYEHFHPLYNSDDYGAAQAMVQGTAEIA